MATNERFENFIEDDDERFSEIELRVLDLEKDVSDWRAARTRERSGQPRRQPRGRGAAGYHRGLEAEPEWEDDEDDPGWEEDDLEQAPAFRGASAPREFLRATGGPAAGRDRGGRLLPADRTQELIEHGRQTARPRPVRRPATRPQPAQRPAKVKQDKTGRAKTTRGKARRGRSRPGRKIVLGSVAGLAVLGIGALIVLRPGASWPASVATVRSEITIACQNPNVAAEPSQVNFACAKDTSQILWVFSLLTSGDDAAYADAKTGRKGLEPITPAQGGEIAWSLNLHHPYNPLSSVDSLEVAARAINNIIGGATLTSASGTPTVQPGLEAKPQNCARYTGSAAIVSHAGFPSLCASPVTSAEGQAALVADVYEQWMPGASAVAAQNASVLFQNAGNPGDPQVQAILKSLPHGE